jgi:Ca-activated chloride channel family protein
VRVGVVAFSGSGLVTQQPTTDRVRVLDAIDRLTPQGGTALARGLQTSLSAIAGKTVQLDASGGSVEPQGQDLGFHGSAAVILLSDGENTTKPDPMGVAELASTAGVRIYPIGLGSPEGTVLDIDGFRSPRRWTSRAARDGCEDRWALFRRRHAAALTEGYKRSTWRGSSSPNTWR